MQISESRSQRVVSVRFGLALSALAALTLGVAGGAEAAQSCSDLVAPQDMEMVSSAAELPGVYIARVNLGDAERVTDLFADDAVHRGPDAVIRTGRAAGDYRLYYPGRKSAGNTRYKPRAALLEFYGGILGNGPLNMAVGKSVAEGNRVAFELVRLDTCDDEDPATAVDLIEVNDEGKIQDFTVFSRPDGN